MGEKEAAGALVPEGCATLRTNEPCGLSGIVGLAALSWLSVKGGLSSLKRFFDLTWTGTSVGTISFTFSYIAASLAMYSFLLSLLVIK